MFGLKPDAILVLKILLPGIIFFTILCLSFGVKASVAYSYQAILAQAVFLVLLVKRHKDLDWPLLAISGFFSLSAIIAHDVLS